MYRIKKIGKQKNIRIKSMSIIKKELGFCMKGAKQRLDDMLEGYFDFEIDNYQKKTYDSIFEDIDYVELEEQIMDMGSSKYQMLEAQQHEEAHQWFDNLTPEEQEHVRTLQSEMIARAH